MPAQQRTPKPTYKPGDRVVSRGAVYVVVSVPRKRRGEERMYELAHESEPGGGHARESDLERA